MIGLDMEGRYRGSVRHDDDDYEDRQSKTYPSLTPRTSSNAQQDLDIAKG